MSSLYVVFSPLIRLASGFSVLLCGLFSCNESALPFTNSTFVLYFDWLFSACLHSALLSLEEFCCSFCIPGWNAYSLIFVFLFQKNKCLQWNFPFMMVLAISYFFIHRVLASFPSKLVSTCNFDFLLFSNGVFNFEGGWFATRDYHIKWSKSERERQIA